MRSLRGVRPVLKVAWLVAAALVALPAIAAAGPVLEPCWLKGVAREARCGSLPVAETPEAPQGRKIRIRYAVVPALAKNKAADPVFFFAGGPGQAATQIAGGVLASQSRLNARRDLVFIDQRGTGESGKLGCARPEGVPSLAEALDSAAQFARLAACIKKVADTGADTAQYATWIAVRDIDAVRQALGAAQINLWGGSYGTRAALEYLRQFPSHVRSVVLDGLAPPDGVLPASFPIDNSAALDRLSDHCAKDSRCARRHPALARDIDRLFADATAGRLRGTVAHPITGVREQVVLGHEVIASALRTPLYVPWLAAMLPHALLSAVSGNHEPLLALAVTIASPTEDLMAEVMHFAVICAEDMPRFDATALQRAAATRFGNSFDRVYRKLCPLVAVRAVPAEFYAISGADVPVLLLSGGADPVTPPRHGEAVAARLKRARHLVAPHLGHGVAGQGCAPELIARFIRQAGFDGLDGECLGRIPAPPIYIAPEPARYR